MILYYSSFLYFLLFCFFCNVETIRVSVMLPLNLFNNDGTLNNPSLLKSQLQQLKSGNIDGVMVDVWWGLVEKNQPQQYNWNGYLQLAQLVQATGLHLQCVMSFHQCGTNVGDQCYITLPPWVLSVEGVWYTDSQGEIDQEYISLGADNESIFSGRSPIQIYTDFMSNFSSTFSSFIKNGVINQIQIGLGPAGEMRYPSYQLQDNRWQYCGIGEFQCYDKYMLNDLKEAANAAGQPNWSFPPNNAGSYNSVPSGTQFFSDNQPNNYASLYGIFFLKWYSQMLLQHGEIILSAANTIFYPLAIAAKVSGIHWWYGTNSHAAECTAGYFNTDFNNAYLEISQMFSKYNVDFDFTCLEMIDSTDCNSQPQELVKQAILASKQARIAFAGENALPICQPNCYQGGFDEIYRESTQYGAIERFTYLRLDSNLLTPNNFNMFTSFVQKMHLQKKYL